MKKCCAKCDYWDMEMNKMNLQGNCFEDSHLADDELETEKYSPENDLGWQYLDEDLFLEQQEEEDREKFILEGSGRWLFL